MATTREAKKALRKEIKTTLSTLGEDEITTQSNKVKDLILSLPQYQKATRLSIYLSMPQGELRTDAIVRDALDKGKKVFIPYIAGKGRSATMDMLRLASLSDLNSLERDDWGIPTLPSNSINERENAAGGTGLVEIEELEAMDGVEAQRYGRETAPGRGEEGTLDLIVMPGVAFDVGLGRLGHGAGYYDGFLTRFCGDGTMKPFLGMYVSIFFSSLCMCDLIWFGLVLLMERFAVGLCLAEQLLPVGREVPTTNSDWIVDALAVGDGRLLTMDD